MKTDFMMLTRALTMVSICFFAAWSCSTNTLQKEAEEQAELWWQKTITKCGNGYYTHYKGPDVGTTQGDDFRINDAYIEFEGPGYKVKPLEVTKSDELNGFQWFGLIAIDSNIPLRYYKKGSKTGWSSWRKGPLMYSDEETRKKNLTPQAIRIGKIRDQWTIAGEHFSKPDCSEVIQ